MSQKTNNLVAEALRIRDELKQGEDVMESDVQDFDRAFLAHCQNPWQRLQYTIQATYLDRPRFYAIGAVVVILGIADLLLRLWR